MQPANILHIKTLNERWADKDRVLLHACFQLLTDCLDQEQLFASREWQHTEAAQHARQELETLAQWWQQRQVQEQQGLDPIWTEGQYELDNQMLIRLIQVRECLWT